MIERALYPIAFSSDWGRQMRFITGPRQSGKTTLAKLKLANAKTPHLYYLWDLRSIRNKYKQSELFFTQDQPPSKKNLWICFDEIHKMPKWKNILKGIFDSTPENYHFIITGSAKFSLSKRAGDSLSGRYFTFHLLPICLRELIRPKSFNSDHSESAYDFSLNRLNSKHFYQDELNQLFEFSGFPEPLIKQSVRFHKKWSQDYLDTVIKEDIGQLTRILETENLYDLYKILPEMVGNPISESSLASHLEISNPTIKNYLKKLEDFYLAFRIYPYSKNIKRSLLKASKCYLYNWTMVLDKGKRFENLVATHLKTQLQLWSDFSGETHDLFYIRNKQKKETDFLITKNGTPWMLIEAKYSDTNIPSHRLETQKVLGNIPLIQTCFENNIALMQSKNAFRISASRFLS